MPTVVAIGVPNSPLPESVYDPRPTFIPISAEPPPSTALLALHDVHGLLSFIGCKPVLASRTVISLFDRLATHPSCNPNGRAQLLAILPSRHAFAHLLVTLLASPRAPLDAWIPDILLALAVHLREVSLVVLLGGTSGCGKSTLASLLGCRLGGLLSGVVSTDTVRAVMRAVEDKEGRATGGVLFSSTYSAAGDGASGDVPGTPTRARKVVDAFKDQARVVMEKVESIVQERVDRHDSVMVEGVHLTVQAMLDIMQRTREHKRVCVLPFLVYIGNEDKHRHRFAVRAKYMALHVGENKYVRNHRNIRCIQDYLCRKADKHDIPKINNSNVDRSLAILHMTIFSALKRWYAGEPIVDWDKRMLLLEPINTSSGKQVLQTIRGRKPRRYRFHDPSSSQEEGLVNSVPRISTEIEWSTERNPAENPATAFEDGGDSAVGSRKLVSIGNSDGEPWCPSVVSEDLVEDGLHWWKPEAAEVNILTTSPRLGAQV